MWRGLLTATGAAAAGAGAVYVTDPAGTREIARAVADDVDQRVKFFTEPSREQLLPDPVPPFPGAVPLRTLIIELDALVHSSYNRQFGWRVAKRPGADAFLAYMSTFYEIVVFTSGLNSYADPILNQLDPNKYYIAYRLYRAETKYEGGVHVKDMAHLNRDLSRVILIDDDAKHFKHQPENAILVPKWSDDPTDTALLDLVPFLEGLVHGDVADVRSDLGTLTGKSLVDGLAEHHAQASSKAGRTGVGRGGLFGAASAPAAGRSAAGAALDGGADGMAAEAEQDGTKSKAARGSSLWGQVSSKSGTLFRPSGSQPTVADGPQDA
jgi:Dullard-like phosphatase family protein